MILSETPRKKKQVNALAYARAWRGREKTIRKYVALAAAASPLSEIQWFNLATVHGRELINDIRKNIEGGKS